MTIEIEKVLFVDGQIIEQEIPERDYERGFIDGMQKQMQSSVDKAVNAMSRTWVGLTDEEIEQLHTAWVLGGGFRQLCNAIETKLKEKNNG